MESRLVKEPLAFWNFPSSRPAMPHRDKGHRTMEGIKPPPPKIAAQVFLSLMTTRSFGRAWSSDHRSRP